MRQSAPSYALTRINNNSGLIQPKYSTATNGASVLNGLHHNPLSLENSIQGVPAGLSSQHRFGQHSLDDLMNPETIDTAQNWTQKITDLFTLATTSAGKVFSQLGDITNVGINKTAGNPMIVTVGALVLGLVAGLKSVKNIIHGVKVGMNSKADPKLGWLPHELLGILQGGLCFGLTSSFLGKKNPFTEMQDGKPVVKVNSLIGAGAAALGLSVAMNLAKGVSVLHKIPFIGSALQEISEMVFGAAKEVTVATESNPNAEQGAEVPG